MKSMRHTVLSFTLASGLVAAGSTFAAAEPPRQAPAVVSSLGGSVGPSAVLQARDYSDDQTVDLLLFGAGQAAQDHPALAQQIRARRARGIVHPTPRPEQISELVTRLRAIDSEFTPMVTRAVQSHDPFVVEVGMQRLGSDLTAYLDQFKMPGKLDGYRPDGIVWHDANIVTEINIGAVINGAIYANVGLATEVAVALVVVPSAVSYGFDMRQPNSLDRDGLVAAVARAL